MSAHTPGPWVAHYSDKFDNYQIFGAGKTGLRPWICNTKCESVPAHHDANARLIAAAPDLLEALHRMADAYVALLLIKDEDPSRFQEPGSPYAKARAAIAKAEGAKS